MVNYKRLLFKWFAAAVTFFSLLIHRVVRYWQLAVQSHLSVVECCCYHYPYKNWQARYSNQQQLFCSLCEGLIASGKEHKFSVSFKLFVNSSELSCREAGVFLYLWNLSSAYSDIVLHLQNLFLEKIYHFFCFREQKSVCEHRHYLDARHSSEQKKLSMEALLAFELQIS